MRFREHRGDVFVFTFGEKMKAKLASELPLLLRRTHIFYEIENRVDVHHGFLIVYIMYLNLFNEFWLHFGILAFCVTLDCQLIDELFLFYEIEFDCSTGSLGRSKVSVCRSPNELRFSAVVHEKS